MAVEASIFNVSSDIPECSAGMRTFVMVPVMVYAVSLVGSFEVDIFPNIRTYGGYYRDSHIIILLLDLLTLVRIT